MRISILIPTHNYSPKALVQNILREIAAHSLRDVELLVWDDASQEKYQETLRQDVGELPGVKLKYLEKNLGRAKIRNAMAQAAQGENLLFLDSDGLPAQDHFITYYLEALRKNEIVVGGRTYASDPPQFDLYLHWKYGSHREQLSAQQRNQRPSFGFQSNNFALRRTLFLQHPFPEHFHGYGHEDTVFGKNLGKQHPIFHIDNTTTHLGLEPRSVFLKKSLAATEQLSTFIQEGALHYTDTRLSQVYIQLKKWGLLAPFTKLGSAQEKRWKKHLVQHQEPSLRILDGYRLLHFARIHPKN